MFVHVCPWLGVFARGKAETRWDFFRPTLCSVSALVRGCGRSLLVSTATETKARWLWKSPRWDCKIHTVSLARWKPFQNLCKWMQKTAEITEDCMLWLFFFFCFFLPQSRNSHIFIYFYFTCPSTCSIVLSSCLSSPSDSPSADLYREERGDWRLPPAEQREEEGPGSCEVSARNMTVLLSPWPSFCYSDGGILRSV